MESHQGIVRKKKEGQMTSMILFPKKFRKDGIDFKFKDSGRKLGISSEPFQTRVENRLVDRVKETFKC